MTLEWAKDVGLPLQSVESDAFIVVQALNKSLEYFYEFGDLLLDASNLLSFFQEHLYNMYIVPLIMHVTTRIPSNGRNVIL